MSGAVSVGRRVLVTGATGFIGAHVVRRLLRLGAEVHTLVRHGNVMARLEDVRDAVACWHGDVSDQDAVLGAVRGARPEVVLHLAADTSVRRFDGGWEALDRSVAVNLCGTLNVLRAALTAPTPVETFVRLGGLEEYGTAPTPFEETMRERPVSPYSASQVAATHYCQMLQPGTGTAIVTLRPALVYGPGQSADFFIPSLIHACLRHLDFALTGERTHRDLLYVEDLVDAILLAAARSDLRGTIINLGHGVEHAMGDVADAVVRCTASRTRVQTGVAAPRAGDLRHLVTATDRATELLGWRPQVTLEDGLARTVAWYRERHEAGVVS